MSRLLSLFLILVLRPAFVRAGMHTIVGPEVLRLMSNYTVSVNLHQSDKPCEFKVFIGGPTPSEVKTVNVQPFSSQQIKFKINDLEIGNYYLHADTVCGAEYQHVKQLSLKRENHIPLIQTDKAIYKASDLIRYRVLILDKYTRPAKLKGPVSIKILDPVKTRIKEIANAQLTSGVYSGELKLSPTPILGKWSISVTSDDGDFQKAFHVDKYVLPKFAVTLDVASYTPITAGTVNVSVEAKYTFGKPVKGDAVVIFKMNGRLQETTTTKTTPIDGKASVSFDTEELYENNNNTAISFSVTAVVTEKLTGAKLTSAKSRVVIHRKKFGMRSISLPPYIDYNVPFDITVAVWYFNGRNIEDPQGPVFVTLVDDGEKKMKPITASGAMNDIGHVTVTFTVPKIENQGDKEFKIMVKYMDQEDEVGKIVKPEKMNVAHFKIQIYPTEPTLKDEITVTVSSDKALDYFFYQILAGINIVKSGYVKVPGKQTTYQFKIRPKSCLYPTAFIYVYYILNGELVYDEKQLKLKVEMPNIIKITAPVETQPGMDVNIKVTAKPNSFVGLMGVDRSVLILKSGNDLSSDNVIQKMRELMVMPGTRVSHFVTLSNAKPPGFQFPRLQNDGYYGANGEDGPGEVAVRKEFPETWIWENIENFSGEITIQKKVPDTITSWVLTGFAVGPYGLGITKQQFEIKVFKPFFVSTSVPYSIKRGEVIAIPAVVFNYQNTDAEVTITFDNSEKEFEFVDPGNEFNQTGAYDAVRTVIASVKSNSGVSKYFLVRPTRIGYISLNLKAVSATAGDAIKQMLLCEIEGAIQYLNKAYVIDLNDKQVQNENVALHFEDAIPGSAHADVTLVGDLLAPTAQNLHKLIRKPWGCGEQNMVYFVPIIFVLMYLEKVKKLDLALKKTALEYLQVGYQQELSYKHDDGSYSAFGKKDPSGSTWVTAYVARSFRQATPYIAIDEALIAKALEFLVKHQAADGSFPEVGKIVHETFSTRTGRSLTLTAFVALALIENKSQFPQHGGAIKKGLDYLARNINQRTDTYDLALATYALQRGQHAAKDVALDNLKGASTINAQSYFWQEEEEDNNANVEITSYAMLALLDAGAGADTLPITKYLISQRNSDGGFDSTQDTVLGLQALVKFAYKYFGKSGKIDLDFKDNLSNSGKLTANAENSLVLQTRSLQPTPSSVSLSAKGNGSALVQVSYRYNVLTKDKNPAFTLEPALKKESLPEFLELAICTSFNGDRKSVTSNMVVMIVSFPSGYIVDPDNLPELENSDRIKRVETRNEYTGVVLYYDDLNTTEVCPEIRAYRAYNVANQKPATVEVYDLYKTSRRAKIFYEIPTIPLPFLCDEDCALEAGP